jgi:hypothetical protein
MWVVGSGVVTNEFPPSFAETLPRLYELASITDQSHPDAYFRDFDDG